VDPQLTEAFGNRLRLRISGLLIRNDRLLLVSHAGLGPADFWAPPGGEMKFSEPAAQTIEREFREETGLTVRCGNFCFAGEFIRHPLHAIELFFTVQHLKGELQAGVEPEIPRGDIIRAARFFSWEEIHRLPEDEKHGLFRFCQNTGELMNMSGFYRF
jgi:ADP-ribose pyrophosphatase YjhB (NUDIX family)